jgi:hypothetical protein
VLALVGEGCHYDSARRQPLDGGWKGSGIDICKAQMPCREPLRLDETALLKEFDRTQLTRVEPDPSTCRLQIPQVSEKASV